VKSWTWLIVLIGITPIPTGIPEAATAISIPCPANSPCEWIQVLPQDNTHVSVTVSLSVPQLQAFILNKLQSLINANLPLDLTRQINLGTARYMNGRVVLHQVTIGPVVPIPPNCGAPPNRPCPPSGPVSDTVPVSVSDEYQKEMDHLTLKGWHNDGWPTLGRLTVFGAAIFGIDAPLPVVDQHVVVILRADRVDGAVTMNEIHFSGSIPLKGKTFPLSFPIVDAPTAAKYSLRNLSIKGFVVQSVDTSHAIVTGTVGPV